MNSTKSFLYIPYYNILQFTKWLIVERSFSQKNEQLNSTPINITILINCCVILEGFLYTLVKDYLFFEGPKCNKEFGIEKKQLPLFSKILEEYSIQLDKDSWNGYIRLFELFTSCEIDKKTELWKAINILFQFRNLLVHGNELEFYFGKCRAKRQMQS